MPTFTIYHDDYSARANAHLSYTFPGCVVFHVAVDTIATPESATQFMNQLISKYGDAKIIIITDIDCDEYHAPCGCTGYDGVCDWHHGWDESYDFAPCLCSVKHNIKCEYHKR